MLISPYSPLFYSLGREIKSRKQRKVLTWWLIISFQVVSRFAFLVFGSGLVLRVFSLPWGGWQSNPLATCYCWFLDQFLRRQLRIAGHVTKCSGRGNCKSIRRFDHSPVERAWKFYKTLYVTKHFWNDFRLLILNFPCLNFVCCCAVFQVSSKNFIKLGGVL